jgi:hypothetical protein
MNEKELKENIEKIKQFLTLPDYDKIDAGIELAVSLEEPKIFETLLDGCSLGGSRPKLNEWMQEIIISDGELINQPTGYYVFLNLITNVPDNAKIDSSLKLINIKNLNLTKCYLSQLPKTFYKLDSLEVLYLEYNELTTIPNDIFQLSNLTTLSLLSNNIEVVPTEISTLENLELLGLGNNRVGSLPDELSNLKKLKHLDISQNNFNLIPNVIYELTNLVNLSCFAYDDDYDTIPSEDETLKEIYNKIPNINILDAIVCEQCDDGIHINDIIERDDGYYCQDCDDQWWGDTDAGLDCCGVCDEAAGPYGIKTDCLDKTLNPDNWDINQWYLSKAYDSWDGGGSIYIIKTKNGDLLDITTCAICDTNFPKSSIASYSDAEKYAEENELEYFNYPKE